MAVTNKTSVIVSVLLTLCVHKAVLAQSSTSTNWRESDRALLQVCFDKLDSEPPKTLGVTVVSESTLVGQTLMLVGYTITKRPIYQGSLMHPSDFQSALITLPGIQSVVKVEKPTSFETYIDVWKFVPSNACFSDRSIAFRMLGNGQPSPDITCPDLGINTTLKVASSSENALVIRDTRERGPKEFNNRRGCREPAYPQREEN
jgi:hypothetical protein